MHSDDFASNISVIRVHVYKTIHRKKMIKKYLHCLFQMNKKSGLENTKSVFVMLESKSKFKCSCLSFGEEKDLPIGQLE